MYFDDPVKNLITAMMIHLSTEDADSLSDGIPINIMETGDATLLVSDSLWGYQIVNIAKSGKHTRYTTEYYLRPDDGEYPLTGALTVAIPKDEQILTQVTQDMIDLATMSKL